MFDKIADEIFEKAGVPKEGNEENYKQVVDILATKMATLSVTMGLSQERVDAFNEHKKSLVEDLIALKKTIH
jgi:hypothetical protein